MKVFLDDLRRPDTSDWRVVRSAEAAIELLKAGLVTEISFDHDLGTELTGYHVARFIEQGAFEGRMKRLVWRIHSANPVGRENIKQAMESAERFWAQRG
jgi:hypothetical protein